MIIHSKAKIYNLLRWSEKWAKTDMIYLVKGGFWLGLGQFISALSALILAIAFANLLPKETYGTYKYILSLCGILAIPTLNGINVAVMRAVSQGKEGSFITGLKTKISWGLLGGAGSLLLGVYYYIAQNQDLALALLIAAFFLPLMDSFNIYHSLLQGKKDFRSSTRYSILTQIFSVLSLVLTIYFTKNLFIILLAYFLSGTILRIIFCLLALKKEKLNDRQDPGAISYGKHLSLILIINSIAFYADRLIIFHFLGAIDVAIYSVAIAPAEQIKALVNNIYNLAFPKFSQKSKEENRRTIRSKTLKLLLIVIAMMLAYIIAAPFLFSIFFPSYLEAAAYSQFYALSLIGAVVILPYTILESTADQKNLYHYNTTTSLIQIILMLVMAPICGLWGIILARIIGRLFNLWFCDYLISKN